MFNDPDLYVTEMFPIDVRVPAGRYEITVSDKGEITMRSLEGIKDVSITKQG